jgi:nifR3 family TIM-barrel protein
MNTLWQRLSTPIFVLAPMEDVTDTVFRRIINTCGKPAVTVTEFTNVEGMYSKGTHIVSQRLLFTSEEHPIVAQIWGKNPKHYYQAASDIKQMGFDGIDINMGCPQKNITRNGSCSALMLNRTLATEIIKATQEGAKGLPVSVKTRIGFNTIDTESWISFILSHDLDALTVHGRTVKEQSLVPCHWDEIGKAVDIRTAMGKQTKILGNGDVESLDQAMEYVNTYQVDGVMIGRGILKNPYLFAKRERNSVTRQELIELAIAHVTLFETVWKGKKPYSILKKYFKIYIQGFDGASELREQLMQTETVEEGLRLLKTSPR